MSWKKHGSKLILNHPRLKVYEDIVELPGGHKTDYIHFGKGSGAVSILAKNTDGKLLIQKEYSYPIDKVLYQLPGGGINKGETPLSAAVRELSEEANLTGNLEQIGWFYADNRRKSDKMYVYLATDLRELTGEKDIEEEFENFWLTEQEINDLIRNDEFNTYSGLASWALYKNQNT